MDHIETSATALFANRLAEAFREKAEVIGFAGAQHELAEARL
jgi:hypothetical protein